MKKEIEIVSCCNDCGKKRYKVKRDAGAITISMGKCPFCKENKPIIPAHDWNFMCGYTNDWD